jgi:hypothetical protein
MIILAWRAYTFGPELDLGVSVLEFFEGIRWAELGCYRDASLPIDTQDDILKNKGYDALWVCRTGKVCSLIIVSNGISHVYSDSHGKTREFRHAWQIKQWLHQRYDIEIDTLEVKTFKLW